MRLFLSLLFISSCSTTPCLKVKKTVDFVEQCRRSGECFVSYTDGTSGMQFDAQEDTEYEVCQ